ncbi:MAG: M1 family metallopeptidase [Candidatus Saccharimonadota bacterium]
MKSVSRLIAAFAPEHYELSITLNRQARTFQGTVTLSGESLAEAAEIRLHAKDLTISSATVDGKEAAWSHHENDELSITHKDITPGKHVVVLGFSGTIIDGLNGIYPSYYEVNGEKKELLVTQLESHYARKAFPCIDEPEAKATFSITLTTETGVTVLGNMPVKTQKEENGLLVTQFDETPRMSTYLVAWVVGELQKKTATTSDGVEVSVWATLAHDPSNLDFALGIATRTIEFFNDYFGVPYPLPKADHVALPDFSAGAMENWGLITYREIALLVDPKNTSLAAKHYVALVVAHELSHQWFGNLVTMKWWNDLWLNESFANMMEYVAIDTLEPGWDIWLDQATTEVVSALRRDSLDGVQSIQTDVNHPDEISTIFDPSIVYAKGGRLLRMLQAYIGHDAMQRGLKQYFETHKYTNTVADDLWAALGAASGKDIAGLMHAWMTQPGYPVVTVSQNGSKVTLSQEQFFVGPHEDASRTWPVPLHGSSEEIPEMLSAKELSFEYTSSKPPRLNKNGTAHFVTHYEPALLAAIIRDISSLSTVDRVNFLNEQVLLAQAGLQPSAALIPLLLQFKDETNESVWSIVAMALNELKRFVETDDAAEARLKKYARELASVQYERLGWDVVDGEDENDTKLRSIVISLSLYGENESAIQEASERFASTAIADLDPELRTAILASAVRRKTDDSIIDTLLAAYKDTSSSELRDDIAAALTSTKDSETIRHLSTLLKDTSLIRMQDFIHWFVWLLRNRYGRTFMWQWTRDNWEWIKTTFESDSHYDMLPRYIAGALVTTDQLAEYRAFFGPLEAEVALTRNITIGYTELEGRVELLERDGPAVRAALEAY